MKRGREEGGRGGGWRLVSLNRDKEGKGWLPGHSCCDRILDPPPVWVPWLSGANQKKQDRLFCSAIMMPDTTRHKGHCCLFCSAIIMPDTTRHKGQCCLFCSAIIMPGTTRHKAHCCLFCSAIVMPGTTRHKGQCFGKCGSVFPVSQTVLSSDCQAMTVLTFNLSVSSFLYVADPLCQSLTIL